LERGGQGGADGEKMGGFGYVSGELEEEEEG
jgi:hypothetical protein